MGAKKDQSNDYAVARLLNLLLLQITQLVREIHAIDLPDDYDWKLDDLNRAYVLLVNELEKLYKQNSKLAEIKPKAFWAKYNILTPYYWEIIRYLDEPTEKKGQAHISQLDRLCIIANSEKPELSPSHLKLLEQALTAIKNYKGVLVDAEEKSFEIDDAYYIPEYWVSYKNGEIVINNVLYLKKTHIGSTIDQLLEQAFKNPNNLFTPELPATARNLSTVLSSAGFVPVLRQLFFPTLSKTKGVIFRPKVTFEQVTKDKIDTTKLDSLLLTLDPSITLYK
jgi:hypothetical protein